MKSVAIFGEAISKKEIVHTCNKFVIDDIRLMAGIIEEEDIVLEEGKEFNNSILVKKIAFSCNFRDRPLITFVNQKVIEGQSNGDLFYSHFGSEFVGEIIQIGQDVKEFKIGDRVIPNISYPSHFNTYKAGIPSNGVSKRYEIFKSNKLIKAPSGIPDEILAAFPVSSFTAYSMIRKTVKPGDNVLITAGKSNTSIAAICALKERDVQISVITSSVGIEQEFYDLGVKNVFVISSNIDLIEDNHLINRIEKAGKFNAVIDPYFDVYFSAVLRFMDFDSKYITCGLANQAQNNNTLKQDIDFRSLMINLMIGNISIIGNCIGLIEDYYKALEDYKKGKYKVIIDSVYTEGEEGVFLERTYNSKERFGKAVYMYK